MADMLGMTTDWIYREVRAGRLPHIRLGRYVRFRQESIDAWLDTCEHGGRVPQGGVAGEQAFVTLAWQFARAHVACFT